MVALTPAETYDTLLHYSEKKAKLGNTSISKLFVQCFMAGMWVSFGAHSALMLSGAMGSKDASGKYVPAPASLQKLLMGLIFPTGLIACVFTGAELFTGNAMAMLSGVLSKKIRVIDLLKNWGMSLLGNCCGCLFIAYFLSYLTETFAVEPLLSHVVHIAEHKIEMSFGVALLKGIGCNVLVCLAIWQALACKGGAGKVVLIWFPVAAFIICGFEHSVANMYYIPLGMMYGAEITIGEMIAKNWIPVIIGNAVGGCVLLGCVYWYEYHAIAMLLEEAERKKESSKDINEKICEKIDEAVREIAHVAHEMEVHHSLSMQPSNMNTVATGAVELTANGRSQHRNSNNKHVSTRLDTKALDRALDNMTGEIPTPDSIPPSPLPQEACGIRMVPPSCKIHGMEEP